ncbi:MAG: acyl-CoA dehydrogenase family protein [Dehalococcoidia bacterium]
MNLDFSEEQDMLRNSARQFASTECTKAIVRELEKSAEGYSPEMWGKMAELGWFGLMIPDEYDGMGMKLLDMVVVFEEIGKNILPSPFLVNTALATPPIVEAGSEALKKEFLPKIAAGEIILTMALTEKSAGYTPDCIQMKAEAKGDSFVLNGTKMFVEYATAANYLVVVAKTKEGKSADGITLFLVDAKAGGVTITPFDTTAADKQCEVVFKDVSVPKKNVIGDVDKGWPAVQSALQQATIAKCAEMCGGMEAMQEMAVAYAKERVQYGKPIGSYQAMQHKLAELYLRASMSKNILYEAAWMAQEKMDCDWKVSTCKAWCNEAYKLVTEDGVHIHGAIGTTMDHDASLYYRRARAAYSIFGDTEDHREVVAKSMGL